VGIVTKKQALSYSFSGVMLRGSGVPWDLRKTIPYEGYGNLQFGVPVGLTGDCFSRYGIRMLEIKESLNLIKQCLSLLTDNSSFFHSFLNRTRLNLKLSMENLINHFNVYGHGIMIKKGLCFTSIEAPKGETGVFFIYKQFK